MTIYRGYDITKNDSGKYEWTDERGFIHNGKIDLGGGYETEDEAMNAVDQYKRNMASAK